MDQDKMKIALVSSSYYPHFGGVEEHVRQVAKELQARGHTVEVWTVDRGHGLRDEVIEGTRVRYLPTPLPARSAPALARLTLRLPRALTHWIRAFVALRPHVINVQCFGPNGIYGTALAKVTGTPLVVSSHGETFADENGIFDRSTILRAGLRAATKWGSVTACSSLVARDLTSRFGANDITVVPNGVGIRTISSPARVVSESSRPIVIGVGRLVPQKGFDLLLKAAAQSAHEPEVWIVGDGAQRSQLEALSAKLGINNRVSFLGQRTSNEVPDLMAATNAVVVPSRAEAFGIVVLEAWMSGTPVLATSRGGPAGFVTDGHDGLLIDPEDISSLTAGMDRLLGDPTLAESLATAGRDTVKSFTWTRVVDSYAMLFRNSTPNYNISANRAAQN